MSVLIHASVLSAPQVRQTSHHTKATESSPSGGRTALEASPLSRSCCNPLRTPLAFVNQYRSLVTGNGCYHHNSSERNWQPAGDEVHQIEGDVKNRSRGLLSVALVQTKQIQRERQEKKAVYTLSIQKQTPYRFNNVYISICVQIRLLAWCSHNALQRNHPFFFVYFIIFLEYGNVPSDRRLQSSGLRCPLDW
jgi:hypothetical protein